MKKIIAPSCLLLAMAVSLFSCRKDAALPAQQSAPKETASGKTGALEPQWDIYDATYVQYTRSGMAQVTFSGGPSSGATGSVFIATCDVSGQITSGWYGPYPCTSGSATFSPPMLFSVPKVAVRFYPSATPPPLASWIGYMVNSVSYDAVDDALVTTL